ncbi:MAG: S10 family peptidase [Anaerolineales bacterium]|jgi:carboxypeptidase C (cathepsin A)
MSDNSQTNPPETGTFTADKAPIRSFTDQLVETQHQVVINGEKISYTVTAGTMILKEEITTKASGEEPKDAGDFDQPKAAIFFVAYRRTDVDDLSQRPLMFSFNGGPGSSSVWLHLGLLGPRRVWMDAEGFAPPPPYRLVDNDFSLLDTTDLVFIDPVSTGFSRALPGEQPAEYHGFKKDIESVGDFIHLFTSRYQRWESPKFLIGESYGTTRAAGLSGYLQERHGMYLNGVLLISSVLNFQTHQFDPGNDLPYLVILPSYTAAAWYHQQLPPDLQEQRLPMVLAEVEQFAAGEYNLALMKGAALTDQERREILRKLARYTGLDEPYLQRSDLRVEIFRFCKELLRSEQRTIGRLDTRFKGFDRDAVGENFEFDPSMTNIQGAYTAMLNHYVRTDLQVQTDLPYEILTSRVAPWSYKEYENKYVDVTETLRKAMTMNPYLKVFIASGYFDLATPYFATQYSMNHLSLAADLYSNITMRYYDAGHMMYIHEASLAKLREDMLEFIGTALPAVSQ